MTTELKNATIESTTLGVEDHGILTFMLHLKYGVGGRGFGGYALDGWDESKKKRVGCAFGMELVHLVLEVLEVERWEKLPGTPCRAVADWGRIYKLGHYLEDKWIDPEALAREFGLRR